MVAQGVRVVGPVADICLPLMGAKKPLLPPRRACLHSVPGRSEGPEPHKRKGKVHRPRPGWCEVRADIEGEWIDAVPHRLYTPDLNNHANERCQ